MVGQQIKVWDGVRRSLGVWASPCLLQHNGNSEILGALLASGPSNWSAEFLRQDFGSVWDKATLIQRKCIVDGRSSCLKQPEKNDDTSNHNSSSGSSSSLAQARGAESRMGHDGRPQ